MGEGQYVFMHLAKSRKVHFWDFYLFFRCGLKGLSFLIAPYSSLSWQDVQCGRKYPGSYERVLGNKTRACKNAPLSGPILAHEEVPVHVVGLNCIEAPGCHLTICGGFLCIGKGLVNAYSFNGKI